MLFGACGKNDDDNYFVFTLSQDLEYYWVSGVTEAGKQKTELEVPAIYKDKPIKAINASFSDIAADTLILPSSIESMKSTDFSSAKRLRKVYFNCEKVFTKAEMQNCGLDADSLAIFVPQDRVELYKANLSTTNRVFANDSKIESDYVIKENETTIELLFYLGKETAPNIPTELLGKEVTVIGASSFRGLNFLKKIVIPNTIVTVEDRAFSLLTEVTELTIGTGVKKIGVSAFTMAKLTKLNYNATSCDNLDGLTGAFIGCGKQTSNGLTLTIGANVKRIPDYLFHSTLTEYRPAIRMVEFETDSQCVYIGDYSIRSYVKFSSFKITVLIPPRLSSFSMISVRDITVIYVPSSSVDAYKSAAGWSAYSSKIIGY